MEYESTYYLIARSVLTRRFQRGVYMLNVQGHEARSALHN